MSKKKKTKTETNTNEVKHVKVICLDCRKISNIAINNLRELLSKRCPFCSSSRIERVRRTEDGKILVTDTPINRLDR